MNLFKQLFHTLNDLILIIWVSFLFLFFLFYDIQYNLIDSQIL